MQAKITPKQWLALAGISILTFTIFLDTTIVANALPTIQRAMSATNTQTQWLLNLIPICLCSLMSTLGRLGDVYGLRKVFYTCMFLMAAFSVACGMASSIESLILFRTLQGITLASIAVSGALIPHNFKLHQRTKAMAIFTSVTGSGLALGPVLGGWIVEALNWRWVFYINFPIVVLGIMVCLFSVIEQPHETNNEKIDWFGAFFFIIAIASFVTVTIQGSDWGWHSPLITGGYSVSLLSLIAFLITESKVSEPILPFRLLANRTFIPCALACATTGLFIMTMLLYNPLYLQNVLHLSPTTSGWLLLTTSIAYIAMSPIAGIIDHKTGRKVGTLIVPALLAVCAFFHAQLGLHYDILLILAAFIPLGLGWAAVNVSPPIAVMATADEKNAGVIIGALWTMFNVGGSVGLAIAGVAFRFLQKRAFIAKLTAVIGTLSAKQEALVTNIIADPLHVKKIATHFSGDNVQHVTQSFAASFISAYNSVCWGMLVLTTLIFAVIYFVMERNK